MIFVLSALHVEATARAKALRQDSVLLPSLPQDLQSLVCPEGQATEVGFTLWTTGSHRQRQDREAPLAGSLGLIDLISELVLCKL